MGNEESHRADIAARKARRMDPASREQHVAALNAAALDAQARRLIATVGSDAAREHFQARAAAKLRERWRGARAKARDLAKEAGWQGGTAAARRVRQAAGEGV
jgi:hypothetical protein